MTKKARQAGEIKSKWRKNVWKIKQKSKSKEQREEGRKKQDVEEKEND